MSLNENEKIVSKKKINSSKTSNSEEEEEEEKKLDKSAESNLNINLPSLTPLYPQIRDESYFDENITNIKIARLSEELPSLRKENLTMEELDNQNKREKINFSETFLNDLTKVPCKLPKSNIIEVVSVFIRHSTLINKLESSYKWKNEEELNNLCNLISKTLSYEKHKKGDIIFKIGDNGNKFYFILNGYVSILKMKEIPKIKMSYLQYFNLCLRLLKEKENYILEETLKKNSALVPIKSIEQLNKLYIIIFKKKLYENIITEYIHNNNTLISFFTSNKESLEKYNIDLKELHPLEDLDKIQEWKSYLIKRIKPTKDDISYFDIYKEYIIRNNETINITYYVYEDFLYLGAGFYFGENALEKGNIYTGGKRNATIRAETDVVCASMKRVDYLNIIEPKKRMEKMKEIKFIHSNFFFKNISLYLFEKNYFHLFSACEYKKDDVVFNMGYPLQNLIFIKEGEVSYNINSSLVNFQNLIKNIYEYIFKNEIFQKLQPNKQNKILNIETINQLKGYINDPVFRKLKGFSFKFIEEFNKKRNFKIATSGENDILGIEELYLNIPCITKVTVLSKKLVCYQINKEHIEQILISEEDIALPFLNASVNKIIVLLQRLQNIKQHYIKYFMQKYEKNFSYEEQKNLGNHNNIIIKEKQNFTNNDLSSYLKNPENEINIDNSNNIDNIKDSNYNNIESKKNSDIFSKTINSSVIYKREDNKSPLKMSLQLSNKIPRIKILNNIKKSNINLKIVENNKIKQRNVIDYHNDIRKKMFKTIPKNSRSEKNKKTLIIGDKNISISDLKKKFNKIKFLSEENSDLIQVIQSNKYNNNNDISQLNESYKFSLLKGKYLKYHLSFVPLHFNNKLNKKNTNSNKFNTESITSNLNSFHLSIFLNKSNNNNQIESRNNDLGNNNIDSIPFSRNQLIPSILTKKKDKKIQNTIFNNYNNNSRNNNKLYNLNSSNKKTKGHINEKIKEFYDQLKSQGCLSYIPKNVNNTFITRKFKQKYKSALKYQNLFKNNASQTVLAKVNNKFFPFIKNNK